jgi:EAL domain-containing protein (putative c-di-GMP-specific phosphodiesterase class I)/CheY-like chemotaxis protein
VTLPQSILAIDDDADIGELILATAQDMCLSCAVANNAADFLENLGPGTTLILLDLVMPEMDGVELLRLLAQRQCKAGIVLMSGVGKRIIETAEELARALGLSVVGHLQKPFRVSTLQEIVARNVQPQPKHSSAQKPEFIAEGQDLSAAIERDEFVLHYQPQIDIASGTVVGVEALVRWRHPVHGLVFPDNFIPRLEKLGLIDTLGWLVMNRALAELPLFSVNANLPAVSINVSVRSLHDLKFPDKVVSLAEQFAVPLDRIILEITESGLIQEISSTLDVLARLRMKHVRLSIDDFGTGYSMMQQLRLIPATELKIDKYFVQHVLSQDSARVLVLKTIEIGHELGMMVVAEGVETAEQLSFLREHKCDIVQGYLFSRPLPPNEFVAWLLNYSALHQEI